MSEERRSQRHVDVMLFEGFEVLDVFGPVEVFRMASARFSLSLVGPSAGPVRSAQGPSVLCDLGYNEAGPADIVLVPGGIGTRQLVHDAAFMSWLAGWAAPANVVSSVYTGSGL